MVDFASKTGLPDYWTKWRPRSLRGFEDNNGWTSIHSEEDLPKEAGEYRVITKTRMINRSTSMFVPNDQEFIEYWLKEYALWKPVESHALYYEPHAK